jgi:hypothetical protein
MGATRARPIRELLVDSTVLAVGGGVLGFFLALLGLRQRGIIRCYEGNAPACFDCHLEASDQWVLEEMEAPLP